MVAGMQLLELPLERQGSAKRIELALYSVLDGGALRDILTGKNTFLGQNNLVSSISFGYIQ
jgi:hypothetical protein